MAVCFILISHYDISLIPEVVSFDYFANYRSWKKLINCLSNLDLLIVFKPAGLHLYM